MAVSVALVCCCRRGVCCNLCDESSEEVTFCAESTGSAVGRGIKGCGGVGGGTSIARPIRGLSSALFRSKFGALSTWFHALFSCSASFWSFLSFWSFWSFCSQCRTSPRVERNFIVRSLAIGLAPNAAAGRARGFLTRLTRERDNRFYRSAVYQLYFSCSTLAILIQINVNSFGRCFLKW